jgi:hypothetical protein
MNRTAIYLLYYFTFSLLTFAYATFVTPVFSYEGNDWIPNQMKLWESFIMLTIILVFIPKRFNKPSDILLHIQLLLPILPMLVLYGASDKPREYIYYTIVSFFILMLIVRYLDFKLLAMPKISSKIIGRILLVMGGLYILSIITFGGLKYLNFDLKKVYEFRSISASNLPTIFGYFSPIVSKVFLPFLLIISIVNKSKTFICISIAFSILAFGMTHHKGTLFYPFLAMGLYYIFTMKNVIPMMIIAYLSIIVISLLIYMINESNIFFGSLLLRRVYFVPAQINYFYYDYFSLNSFILWAESKLTLGLIDYQYPLSMPRMIGLEYFGNEITNANTGWIGSGYAQAGLIGMIIYSVIIGIIFNTLNIFSKRVNKNIILPITIVPVFSVMTSSDLPTAFLTHGLILVLILVSILAVKPQYFYKTIPRYKN